MASATASDNEDNAFEPHSKTFDAAESDSSMSSSNSCFLLAETQEKLAVIYSDTEKTSTDNATDDRVEGLVMDGGNDETTILFGAAASDELNDLSLDEMSMDQEHLLEYHTEAAVETVNLLLPEMPSTATLDCTTHFADFDEFNLCLNNILSDDDDNELSPNDVIGEGDLSIGSSSGGMRKAPNHSLIDGWKGNGKGGKGKGKGKGKRRTAINEADDFLDIVQLSEDVSFGEASLMQTEMAAATTTRRANETALQQREPHPHQHQHQRLEQIRGNYKRQREDDIMDEEELSESTEVNVGINAINDNENDGNVVLDVINRNSHSIVNIFQ